MSTQHLTHIFRLLLGIQNKSSLYDRVWRGLKSIKNTLTMSFVNDKMKSAFECKMRSLNEGEEPKREGQNTVYEATGNLNPEFVADLKAGELQASVKIDGTCCMISAGTLYRRLDIRKGAVPPNNAIMGALENGVAKICWVPVNGSTDGGDKWHLSAIDKYGFWSWNPKDGPYMVPWDDVLEDTTFELIGPKVQANLYGIPEALTSVSVVSKKVLTNVQVPRHYLIRHGDFTFDFPTESLLLASDKVAWFKNFILSNNIEGIVFRKENVYYNRDDKYYKVNRGHIGTPTKHSDRLVLTIE